jgi:hypothetical protein
MTALDQLTNQQLGERSKLEKSQTQNLEALLSRQLKERQAQGDSPELNRRHSQEERSLRQKHSQEGQELWSRHEKEYQDELVIQQQKSKLENGEIERERTAINVEYTEEREKTRQNNEAYEESRQSLIEKMKQQWAKNREKDRDH